MSQHPTTAALAKLMKGPKLRRIFVKSVLPNKITPKSVATVYVKSAPLSTTDVPTIDIATAPSIKFNAQTKDELISMGLVPLLEHFPVTVEQLPLSARYFQIAITTLALQAPNSTLRLQLQHPTTSGGWRVDKIFGMVDGHDVNTGEGSADWTFRLEIPYDSVVDQIPQIPFPERTDFILRARAILDPTRKSTPEVSLAKLIVATISGYAGPKSEAKQAIELMLAKYSTDNKAVGRIQPWKVVSVDSQVSIIVRPDLTDERCASIAPILCPSSDRNVVGEIAEAMLTELMSGGDCNAVFRAGASRCGELSIAQATGQLLPPRKPCSSDVSSVHWHTCRVCIRSLPCTEFRDQGLAELICAECRASGEVPDLPKGPQPKRPYHPKKAGELTKQWLDKPKIMTQVRRWIKDECQKLKKPDAEMEQEVTQARLEVKKAQQADTERKWTDMYIQQTLDEEGQTHADWTGRQYSPFTPSVEAIRPIAFKDGLTRYHVPGNIGVTANSINLLLGRNPKIILKAIPLLRSAQSAADVDHAYALIYICMLLRCEMDLNDLLTRAGTPESQYLKDLATAFETGSAPPQRYVPDSIVLQTTDSRAQFNSHGDPDNRPTWRPSNVEYLKTELSKLAKRYNLDQPAFRALWERIEPQSNNEAVPVPCDNVTLLPTWTWWNLWKFASSRLTRLQSDCDAAVDPAYRNDPESLTPMNVERMILAMMHIYMSKLDENRNRTEHYPGQPLRALDDAGLPWLLNIRSPFTLSVAHVTHGQSMRLGWVDPEIELPIGQGADVFDHNIRNVTIETQLANLGRWTDNVERHRIFAKQLDKIRISEDELLPDCAPPYPPGPYAAHTLQQVSAIIHSQPLPPDNDFRFQKEYRAAASASRLAGSVPATNASNDDDNGSGGDGDVDTDMADLQDEAPDSADMTLARLNALQDYLDQEDEDLFQDFGSGQITEPRSSDNMFPQRANLGRGKATCYVSGVVQILYNITPLFRASGLDAFRRPVAPAVLRFDADGRKHEAAYRQLQNAIYLLTTNADTSTTVDTVHTQLVRSTLNALTTLSGRDNEGTWQDEECDAAEFMDFVIQTLNDATDRSGCVDRNDSPLRQLEESRRRDAEVFESLKLDLDADATEHWNARAQSGYASTIDHTNTVQLVGEAKCDGNQCGAIRRRFEFSSVLFLPLSEFTSSSKEPCSLSDLRDEHLRRILPVVDGVRTSCPTCQAGTLQEEVIRVVNEPDVLMLSFVRATFDKSTGKGGVLLSPISGYKNGKLDLKDWSPRLPSDTDATTTPSASYDLKAVLYYCHSPPHFFSVIWSDSDEAWIRYDDTEGRPRYTTLDDACGQNVCENLLVYVKSSPATRQASKSTSTSVGWHATSQISETDPPALSSGKPSAPESQTAPESQIVDETVESQQLIDDDPFGDGIVPGSPSATPVGLDKAGTTANGKDPASMSPSEVAAMLAEAKKLNKANAKEREDLEKLQHDLDLKEQQLDSRERALGSDFGRLRTILSRVRPEDASVVKNIIFDNFEAPMMARLSASFSTSPTSPTSPTPAPRQVSNLYPNTYSREGNREETHVPAPSLLDTAILAGAKRPQNLLGATFPRNSPQKKKFPRGQSDTNAPSSAKRAGVPRGQGHQSPAEGEDNLPLFQSNVPARTHTVTERYDTPEGNIEYVIKINLRPETILGQHTYRRMSRADAMALCPEEVARFESAGQDDEMID